MYIFICIHFNYYLNCNLRVQLIVHVVLWMNNFTRKSSRKCVFKVLKLNVRSKNNVIFINNSFQFKNANGYKSARINNILNIQKPAISICK